MSGYRYAVGKINAHGIFENLFKNQRHFKDEAYARRVLENNQKFINDELVVQKVHALSPEMALREEIESLKAQLEATKKELERERDKFYRFTRLLEEHPEDWNEDCECQLCQSYMIADCF